MQQTPAAQPFKRVFNTKTLWTLVKHKFVLPGLDLVFPPACIGCGRVDVLLCESCRTNIEPPDNSSHQDTTNLTAITALGAYTGVLQKAVHALKYEHHTALAQPLGRLLAEQIRALNWPVSVIMPVPLHPERLQKRGYNQSGLLAQETARQLHWRYEDQLLQRVKATPSQVGLDFSSRQENVKQAFGIANPVRTANVILVDDVYTTGATIRECATTLMAANDTIVRACVVGRTKFS